VTTSVLTALVACVACSMTACGPPAPPGDPAPPAWQLVASATGPAARWGHVAVWDPRRSRMIVYGGSNWRRRFDDTWAFTLATRSWERLDTGPGPTARYTAAAVIDAARDRMIVAGGDDGVPTADVWALDLATLRWSRLPEGPDARFDAMAATDGRRAWFFAGLRSLYFEELDDLWELDLATDRWSALPNQGTRPPATSNSALAYHRGALYTFGGHATLGPTPGAFRYDLATQRWSQRSEQGTAGAITHFAYAMDDACGVLWLTGGDASDYYDVATSDGLVLGDTVRVVPLPATQLPTPRRHAVLAFDPATRTLVVFGGSRGLSSVLDDTWTYTPPRCP